MEAQINLFGEKIVPVKKKRMSVKKAKFNGPFFPLADGGMSKLEHRFWQFHTNNPKVYRHLVTFARQWRIKFGPDAKLGIKSLFERVRWEVCLSTTNDPNFKLNNNHTAFYARLIMDRNAELAGIFNLRKQRIQSSFGPANEKLSDGEQMV
jgi:hypothetical protein